MKLAFRKTIAAGSFALVSLVPSLEAQCPDGSAPPCRSAAAPARRAAPMPALDVDTWIIVPFDNLAKAEDAEWLRSASVNLLYLDMSRWRDIRVVDDERVADLLRETPEASGSSALSLNAGIAVAKRAGAGKLVMGDILKLGNRTTVTAKIYDVRTGQRVRSVKEDALVQDSVMPLFGKLAQRILNVAPPPGANVGALGTTRTDAYQEYLAGIAALNRFDLREARRRLGQAIALDSTFALAHYRMATVVGWDDPGDPAQRRHAESASRLQAGLPPRVRALITAVAHQAANEWTKSCELFSSLVKADSADAEAWYGLGECLYHDPTAEAIGGDTNRVRFRADWQQSMRAFRRVLDLDPQYHIAYQHIIDALTTPVHNAAYCAPTLPACIRYTSYVLRSGDTLLQTPLRAADLRAFVEQGDRYAQTRSRRLNLIAAHEVATEWVRNAPSQSRAQLALATILAALGNPQQANVHLRNTAATGSAFEEMRRLLLRMEVAHKIGQPLEAIRLYDSARAANGPLPGNANNPGVRLGNAIAGYGLAFGRLLEFDSLLTRNVAQQGAPPPVLPFNRAALRAAIGGPVHDSLAAFERELFDFTLRNRGAVAATRAIGTSLQYALLVPRASWPAIDTTVRDLKLWPALALSRGDTTGVRAAARAMDSILTAITATIGTDTGYSLVAAQAYLALRDTTAALRTLRYGLDTAMATSAYFPMQGGGFTPAYFAPRLMLMRADLAAAKGFTEEARIWYKRFLDVWATAVPEFQPVVAGARARNAAAGGTE